MFNANDRLELILESINIIEDRMLKLGEDEDVVSSKEGLTLLDAITMRLQTIGENFSKIYKGDPALIDDVLKLDVTPIIGFRRIVSHLTNYSIIRSFLRSVRKN